jgi:hypothetical protein
MSLTIEQIAAIKAFIHKRGFNTIEVEMEALDHLASKVESLLEERSDMDFDLALRKAHSSLGTFGLSTFEESIYNGCKERTKIMRITLVKSYLKGNNLLITIGLLALGLLFSKFLLSQATQVTIAIFMYSFVLSMMILPSIYFTKFRKKWAKRSMTISSVMASSGGLTFFIAIVTKDIVELSLTTPILFQMIFILVFVIVGLTTLINLEVMKNTIAFTEDKYLKYA